MFMGVRVLLIYLKPGMDWGGGGNTYYIVLGTHLSRCLQSNVDSNPTGNPIQIKCKRRKKHLGTKHPILMLMRALLTMLHPLTHTKGTPT